MNFSVGVNMYKLNVTSYWYLFLCNQRKKEAKEVDIFAISNIFL